MVTVTQFFYASVISHRRKNKIFTLKDSNNYWLYEEGVVKANIVNYFFDLFSTFQILLVNKVSTTKLGWRLHKEKEALWAKVLDGKHKHLESNLTSFSPIWKGIQKGKNLIDKGTRILLKSGLNTSFWFQN
ncbi:hypothetical protein ACSBR1_027041 [Camellia fascicularis]